MKTLDDYMDGFYRFDYNNKPSPKSYIELKVQAFEMKNELTKLISKNKTIKTGFRGESGKSNREYIIFYK